MNITSENFADFEKPSCLSSGNNIRFKIQENDRVLLKYTPAQNMWLIATVLKAEADEIMVEVQSSDQDVRLSIPRSKVSAILLGD